MRKLKKNIKYEAVIHLYVYLKDIEKRKNLKSLIKYVVVEFLIYKCRQV
jgi:hypothetical protein